MDNRDVESKLRGVRNYRQDVPTAMQNDCVTDAKNGVRKYVNGFTVTMHEYALNMPRLLYEPSFIFVCSMADLSIRTCRLNL